MRKTGLFILAAGTVASVLATDARVITMGRSDNLFMDDVSIYKNPANINVYPNMLIGSMGVYVQEKNSNDTGLNALKLQNRDPQKPFFGGILSYSLNQGDSASQYPMISLAATINMYDWLLRYITPDAKEYLGTAMGMSSPKTVWVEPVGKVDVMLGATLANGGKIGIGTYLAFQRDRVGTDEKTDMKSNLFKGTAGINWPVGADMDLEVSAGVGVISKTGMDTSTKIDRQVVLADNDMLVNADIRLFSALPAINGDFVPHIGFEYVTFKSGVRDTSYPGPMDTTITSSDESKALLAFNAGVGVNMNIDRGFFWTGVEGFFESNDEVVYTNRDNIKVIGPRSRVGGRASVGVERNVIWDWLVWRVGASKAVYLEKLDKGDKYGTTRFVENAEADASDEDMVSFGMGLNIENRLKVDAVVAEDLFYTFTNLISGNMHHFSTRITATYSF